MRVLETLRIATATAALGSIVLVGAKDVKTENIRDAAVRENRRLTKEELEYTQNKSFPFYFAISSIPAWLLIRQLDERNQTKKKNEGIIDYQI